MGFGQDTSQGSYDVGRDQPVRAGFVHGLPESRRDSLAALWRDRIARRGRNAGESIPTLRHHVRLVGCRLKVGSPVGGLVNHVRFFAYKKYPISAAQSRLLLHFPGTEFPGERPKPLSSFF